MKTKLTLTCLILVLLNLIIEPNVRFTSIKDQKRFIPTSISSSFYKLQNVENTLLHPDEWCYVSTGLTVDIPKGYHGHFYPVRGLNRDGIHLLTNFMMSGVNQTLAPILINRRVHDYMLRSNQTIAFIVFVKHLVQDTLEEIKF